jgi:hypothetical protein
MSTIVTVFSDITTEEDGLSAHKDLQTLRIREEPHPQVRLNGKVYLPSANYTLTTEEKRAICK